MTRKPIPAIITLYMLFYIYFWIVITSNNIDPFNQSMLIGHALGLPSLLVLIIEVIMRVKTGQPILKKLLALKLT